MENLNEKQQIEEMADVIASVDDSVYFYDNNGCKIVRYANSNKIAEALYNENYRKQSEVELRIETTTDDFKDLEIAKERGYHRKKFYCPNCDLLIKIETWDSKRMFGGGSILKSNEMPKFCPECGARMKGGAEE